MTCRVLPHEGHRDKGMLQATCSCVRSMPLPRTSNSYFTAGWGEGVPQTLLLTPTSPFPLPLGISSVLDDTWKS